MYRSNTAIKFEPGRNRMHSPCSSDTMKIDLNGTWKALVYESVEEVPKDWSAAVPIADYREIPVPGCFEMQGIGLLVYTNIQYPFERGEDRSFEKEVTEGRMNRDLHRRG